MADNETTAQDTSKKYLDYTGLTTLTNKIKESDKNLQTQIDDLLPLIYAGL